MATKVPPKRDVMLTLLQQAESVYVNFDPRREGVLVPPHLKKQPRVVLQYGMHMAIPIPDLDVGEEGIGATLSFDRAPTWTFVPWSAVFAIVSQDQRGMLWENDMPREIEVDAKKPPPSDGKRPSTAEKEKEKEKTSKPSSGKKQPKRPALRAVVGGQSRPAPAMADAALPPEPPAPPVVVPASEPSPEPPVARPEDEIVEPPRQEKKKRELPPYLRVVK